MPAQGKTPTVTLGGLTMGGSDYYDWPLSSGVQPAEIAYTVSGAAPKGGAPSGVSQTRAEVAARGGRGRAKAFTSLLGKPTTLRIARPTKPALVVQRVYLLEVRAAENPYTSTLYLADARWLWPTVWVSTTLNLRRATGDKQLYGDGPLETKILQPELRYARYSLDPPQSPTKPWTARRALEWLFAESELKAFAHKVRFEDEPPEVEIQDLELEHDGASAVEQVLAYLPGMSLYLDYEGNVVVYSTTSGKEAALFERASKRPHRGGGWAQVADRRALRASKVIVLFTPEVELRVDSALETGGTSVEDTNTMTNVGEVTDVELTIAGNRVARGSYASLSSLFTAWGAFGHFNRVMTFRDLRRDALKYGWARFEARWGLIPHRPPDPVNMARAQMVTARWRHLYQIDRFFVQRCASIRPFRASIVNPETGAFAPAEVFCDWIRRPSYKGVHTIHAANPEHGWAVRGYADRLADAKRAPVRVNVVDEAAGVIELVPQLDPYGLSQAMVLGYPAAGLPYFDLGAANRLGLSLYGRWDMVEVADDFRAAVVLTVVPGSPNTTARLHAVEVKPSELGTGPSGAIGACEGPPVYLRVFPGVMSARFGWSDDRGQEIVAAIRGVGKLPAGQLLNGDLVADVAKAAARRYYEPLRDRVLGSLQTDMDPSLAPAGTVAEVRHTMSSGACETQLTFRQVSQPADIWRYLNASTRRAILRVLNTPTGR